MEKYFEIKITFEQNGKQNSIIFFSTRPGQLGTLFDIKLIRAGKNTLANQIAKSVFRMISKRTQTAIQLSGQSREAKA